MTQYRKQHHFLTSDPDYALWMAEHEREGESEDSGVPGFSLLVIPTGIPSGSRVEKLFREALDRGRESGILKVTGPVSGGAGPILDILRKEDAPYTMLLDVNCVLSGRAFSALRRVFSRTGKEGEDRDLSGREIPDLIYGDEDLLNPVSGLRSRPFFKPDWSPDLLKSVNYFGPSVIYRTGLLREILPSAGKEKNPGAFLQQLNLLCAEASSPSRIVHIPEIICHIGDRELFRHCFLESRALPGPDEKPKVSIIIPSKDHFDLLSRCIRSILSRTSYPDYELIVVDNGSDEFHRSRCEMLAEETKEVPIRYLYHPMEFNFSRMCNIGADASAGELLVFLNDDVVVTQEDWLERMASQALVKNTGAVGVKLLYPDGRIQHCGVVNLPDGPRHSLNGLPDDRSYAFGRNRVPSDFFSVTAACMMVEKKKYREAGGFDESLAVTYNDVDFCLSLSELGYYSVLRPDVCLIHDESASRGRDVLDVGKLRRLNLEQSRMYRKHGVKRGEDPFYSPNLTRTKDDFSIRTDDMPYREPVLISSLPGKEADEISVFSMALKRPAAGRRIRGQNRPECFAPRRKEKGSSGSVSGLRDRIPVSLSIDRIRCGEEILIMGSCSGRLRGYLADLRVYVRAGADRFLLADTKILTEASGEEIRFSARLPQRVLTRERSRLGIVLTTRSGNRFHCAAKESDTIEMRELPVADAVWHPAGKDGGKLSELRKPGSDVPVLYHLDSFHMKRGILSVRGWAFPEGELHSDRLMIQILACSEDGWCLLDLVREERHDVAKNFEGTPNLLYSGFHRTCFLPDELDPERTDLYLVFTSLETGRKIRKRIARPGDGDIG